MWFNINMRSPVPIYKQIKRNIYKSLLMEKIKDGEMLPSIRDLASTIRVNPNTVARAYREMESEGIVVARQGLGYIIITDRNQIRIIILEELKKDLSDYLIRYKKLGVTLEEVLEVTKTLWKENKV